MNPEGVGQVAAAPDFWLMMLKSIGMLCIVLAVLIGLLVLIKKLSGAAGSGGGKNLIKHLSSFHITPKERVMLMEVMDKRILIGVTQNSISNLALFDAEEMPEPVQENTDSFFKGLLTRACRDQQAGRDDTTEAVDIERTKTMDA